MFEDGKIVPFLSFSYYYLVSLIFSIFSYSGLS